jgi:dolichol kinase
MSEKKTSEILRKSIHISSLAIPFTYRYLLSYNRLLMFIMLFGILIILVGIELYRIQEPTFRKFFHSLFGITLRRHEHSDFTGATFLILSALLSVVFFKPIIAFLAMCFLSIGDTFAAVVGLSLGKRKFVNQSKSLEGSMACFVSILIFAIIFGKELSPWVYVTGCLAATLAELWRIPLDDNLKMPLLSGLAMTFVNIFV